MSTATAVGGSRKGPATLGASARVEISDRAKAILSLQEERTRLEAQQMRLCTQQWLIQQKLEALDEAEKLLWERR